MWENGLTVLDGVAIYGGNLTSRATTVSFGSSSHMSTDDWLQIRRWIIGSVVGVVNISYYSTVEGRISEVCREEQENKCAHRRRK